jgi:predicted MFS family arabinose efflux permease
VDRRRVLLALTGAMLASLVIIALAPSFPVLMIARALLGVTIGGFWALSTATVMRLVPAEAVPKALGMLYTGNAIATTFAAPIGSYLGSVIGWRGVFWALVPIVLVNLGWQWISLPALPAERATPIRTVFALLRQRTVRFGLASVMLTFAGAFTTFTYLRPFLEQVTHVSVSQLSLLLLGLGSAGFVGTYGASKHAGRRLWTLLRGLPLGLAAATLVLLGVGDELWPVAAAMIAWGALNAAIPVAWSTWVSTGFRDDPESGGGLMVAAIQLAILLGAAIGGVLLDHVSITATFAVGAALLVGASLLVGRARGAAGARSPDDAGNDAAREARRR